MSTFELTIAGDSRVVYSGASEYCGVTTLSGSIGFKAFHEAFLGILKPESDIEFTDNNGETRNVTVHDGILSFKNNVCTITVSL